MRYVTLGLGLLVMGCGNNQQTRNSSASGSLALSTDDSLLYAADSDNGVVSVIDTKSDAKLYDIKVGQRPMRLAVGSDDTVYVANRGSRSVSVIRKGERQVSGEIATGVDPTGMAVGFDGKTLYVVSATAKDTTDYGILQAVDTRTLQVKYEKPLGYEPRSIALVSNDKALVTQLRGDVSRGADVMEVNLKSGEVTNGGNTGIHDKVNFAKAADPTAFNRYRSNYSSFKPRAMTDVVVTPDGNRAFVPTVWAREDNILRRPSSSGGYYSGGGPCNVGSVATAGVVTVETGANTTSDAKVDDLTACATRGTNTNTDGDYPPTALGSSSFALSTGSGFDAVQGPSAAALDPTGEWLFIVNKETSNVAVMPAWRRQGRDGEGIDFQRTGTSLRNVVNLRQESGLSSGADGVAITRDGRRAYVYNQFDHQVVRLGEDKGSPSRDITVQKRIDLALRDTLSADQALGRRFFFDAQSEVMSSSQTHVACATCHLEGRDDGHVWNFPDGLRQTPTLVGRGMGATAPLHWTGEFADFSAFMNHTVQARMGGNGDAKINAQILGWLEAEPAPENANVGAVLTAKQEHGKAAFSKAGCNNCHSGAYFTNLKMEAVGTTEGINTRFDTPSLKGVARSAPYMHDGRYSTLLDRVGSSSNLHGDLSQLTSDEKVDLTEYLKTL